ncbi:PepSY domain-containing protein [Streptomyces sp. NPDC048172]|uniref:PepSY domain-containing protein n=1 Tax=Streptomyces sp. NPDC048172 TaxID=3365505 RepID=UPI00371517FC
MKRKVIIATVAAAALIGGGTATAVGVSGGSGDDAKPLPQSQSQVRLSDDDDRGDHDDDLDSDDRDGRDHDDRDDDGRDDDGSDKADRDESSGNAAVSADEAHERVLKAVPGTVTELELDTDDNRLTWEADVLGKNGTWHKVELDAGNGKVLRQSDDRDDKGGSEARTATVSASEAAQKAASSTNGSVTSIDLERGHWEIDSVDKKGVEHEVSVDAKTGKVTQQQSDHDDDHDSDADDDDHDDD